MAYEYGQDEPINPRLDQDMMQWLGEELSRTFHASNIASFSCAIAINFSYDPTVPDIRAHSEVTNNHAILMDRNVVEKLWAPGVACRSLSFYPLGLQPRYVQVNINLLNAKSPL